MIQYSSKLVCFLKISKNFPESREPSSQISRRYKMYCVMDDMPKASHLEPFAEWTDEDILLEYRITYQREAFEELVRRYERELFNYLNRYLGDAGLAEDVFQNAFLQVHLKCDQFDEDRKFRPWLYRIATNLAIDIRRKTKNVQEIGLHGNADDTGNTSELIVLKSNEPDPAEKFEESEQVRLVREALQDLPEVFRQVLYLVYFQGMKYREAAESLGVPFGTVKSRLNIAVKKLNSILKD